MVGGEHELMAEKGADGAAFLPSSRRGTDGFGSEAKVAEAFEQADQVEILQDRPIGESAEVIENASSQEESLVAVGRFEDAAAQVDEAFDEGAECEISGEREAEGSGTGAGSLQDAVDHLLVIRRWQGVGVEKEEELAGGGCGGQVHLGGAAFRGMNDPCSGFLGNVHGAVLAPAIGDDDFVGVLALETF